MLIKNAKIVTIEGVFEGDVKIENGLISQIGNNLSDDEVLDNEGRYLLPAFIDLNVRLLDDKVNSSNFARLSQMALAGGVSGIGLIPDLQPPVCDEISLEFVKSQRSDLRIYPFIMALKNDTVLSEISILLKKGAAGVYSSSDINEYLLARVFEYAKMHKIALHIEPKNRVFRDVGVMDDGEVSFRLGLGGISKLEEISEIARIIEFSEYYQVPVLFKSVSTAKGLDLIAKSRLCYAEVSIHHLLFCDEACEGYNTFAKLTPPLRQKSEQKLLVKALQDGKIDCLTSLHSPKSLVNKDRSFAEAGFGIDAISYYLSLLYTKLVTTNIIDFRKLVELCAANPACFIDGKSGKIEEGMRADLVIFDPNKKKKVDIPSLYIDEELSGEVVSVIIDGKVIDANT